jgi:hypothetical protein
MATDLVSVAIGLCGVINLADAVHKQGRQFLHDCSDCPGELNALVLEVNSLKEALEALGPLVDAVDTHNRRTAPADIFGRPVASSSLT